MSEPLVPENSAVDSAITRFRLVLSALMASGEIARCELPVPLVRETLLSDLPIDSMGRLALMLALEEESGKLLDHAEFWSAVTLGELLQSLDGTCTASGLSGDSFS